MLCLVVVMFESFVLDLSCYNGIVIARCMELWCVCPGRVKLFASGCFFFQVSIVEFFCSDVLLWPCS